MPTIGEFKPGQQLKILAYGMSKVGKTEGAATFPRPCFLDFDRGITTLTSPGFIKRHGYRPGIIYEQFVERNVDSRGVVKDHNAFDDGCRYFDKMMQKDNVDTFDTWVVDTGTSLSEAAMNKAIVLLGSDKFKGNTSNTLKMGQQFGLVLPKQQDFGSERSMVEQFILMVKDTPKHVVFLCHEKELFDADGDLRAVVPLLTGKGVEAICAMFDEVWNIRTRPKGPERFVYAQTVSDGFRKCGSRLGIPNETAWNYESITQALNTLNQEKEKLTNASH